MARTIPLNQEDIVSPRATVLTAGGKRGGRFVALSCIVDFTVLQYNFVLLNLVQTKCLRTVTGAYRATPARLLETEAIVPPLDLYLNQRVADFEVWLKASSIAAKIQAACTAIRIRLH